MNKGGCVSHLLGSRPDRSQENFRTQLSVAQSENDEQLQVRGTEWTNRF